MPKECREQDWRLFEDIFPTADTAASVADPYIEWRRSIHFWWSSYKSDSARPPPTRLLCCRLKYLAHNAHRFDQYYREESVIHEAIPACATDTSLSAVNTYIYIYMHIYAHILCGLCFGWSSRRPGSSCPVLNWFVRASFWLEKCVRNARNKWGIQRAGESPRCRAYPPLVLSVRNLDDAEEKNIYNDYRFRITFLPRIIQLINRIARVLQPPQGQIQTLGDAGEEKKEEEGNYSRERDWERDLHWEDMKSPGFLVPFFLLLLEKKESEWGHERCWLFWS